MVSVSNEPDAAATFFLTISSGEIYLCNFDFESYRLPLEVDAGAFGRCPYPNSGQNSV